MQLRDAIQLPSFDAINAMVNDMVRPLQQPKLTTSDWDPVVSILQEMERGYFASSAGPSGTPWAPNRPSTRARKGHGIILRETWELERSLTGLNDKSIRRYETNVFTFGTNRPWAWLHQEGGKKVPQREFLGMTDSALDSVVQEVADAVVEMMFK